MSQVVLVTTALLIAALVRWGAVKYSEGLDFEDFGLNDSRSSPTSWEEHLIVIQFSDSHVDAYKWVRWVAHAPELANAVMKHASSVIVVCDSLVGAALLSMNRGIDGFHPSIFGWIHIINPLIIMSCCCRSLASVEQLCVLCIVWLASSTSFSKGMVAARCLVAFVAIFFLELDWLALVYVSVFNTAKSSRKFTVLRSAALLFAASIIVMGDRVFENRGGETSSLRNSSPDAGPGWYVWQLMPSVFDSPYISLMRLMPVIVIANLSARCIGLANQSLSRRFLAVWAVCTGILCRRTFTIVDACFVLELTMAFTPEIFKRIHSFFVPIVGTCMCLPLQQAFFNGWVSTRTMNANWLFFAGVFQLTSFVVFLIQYLNSFL